MNDGIDPTNPDSQDPWGTPPTPPPFGEMPTSPPTPQQPQEPVQPSPPQPFVQPGATPPPPPPFQAPAQGTYYSNTQGYNVAGPKNDPFAITSLATGIPGVILSCCCIAFPFILGIIAIVFGFLSMGRIQKSQGQLTGRGMAIGGLSCGIAGIVIGLGLVIVNVVFGSDLSFNNY